MASQAAHSVDWLYALLVSSLGLRLDDKAVRIAVGICLVSKYARNMLVLGEPLSTQEEHMVCLVAGVQADSSGTVNDWHHVAGNDQGKDSGSEVAERSDPNR